MNDVSKKHLEWAKKELELNGFIKSEYGKTILKALEQILELAETNSVQQNVLSDMLNKLVLKIPLSELTDSKDEWDEPDQAGVSHNKRYRALCRHEDGTLYDNEAIMFRTIGRYDRMFSKKSIRTVSNLPYYPYQIVKYVELGEDISEN